MKDYSSNITEFFQGILRVYDFFNPEYARDQRMARFEELVESGKLESMCASDVHTLVGIRRISNEF